MPKADPLAAVLDALQPERPGSKLLLPQICSPEGLAAVKAARLRGLSFDDIAVAIGDSLGRSVSPGAVRNWLKAEGVK